MQLSHTHTRWLYQKQMGGHREKATMTVWWGRAHTKLGNWGVLATTQQPPSLRPTAPEASEA